MHSLGCLQQPQMRRTDSRCRCGLLDSIVRRTKTSLLCRLFVSVGVCAVLATHTHTHEKRPLFGMHTGKCLDMQTAAVSLKWPMSHRYPAMSRFVFLSVSNFMRQWCVTAVTRTRKVPRCPGIHSTLLTRLLDFAFVPPISLLAKLPEMRFLLSVEFLSFFFGLKDVGGGLGKVGATTSSSVSICLAAKWVTDIHNGLYYYNGYIPNMIVSLRRPFSLNHMLCQRRFHILLSISEWNKKT